ncbi:hypothetical protein OU798_07550 [Prolixibacteraceae bacterium Z1-6]|uniref:Uncharacterized protein n=1 Tax=Draconibacterium aestuarii TaxID=2998507 RepID=A0A9X3J5R0_9BACT|nr:hypothetical protein [Prolixibacteraceae bacterium Z1-6]
MSTILNKKEYSKMIYEDIERLEKEMQPSPERDHIKSVLLHSVASYSHNVVVHGGYDELIEIVEKERDRGVIIVCGDKGEVRPPRTRPDDFEKLLITPTPIIEDITTTKSKRTNHERKPSRYGKR